MEAKAGTLESGELARTLTGHVVPGTVEVRICSRKRKMKRNFCSSLCLFA